MAEQGSRPAAGRAGRGPRYCLRGLVRGQERRFFLLPGINQVGSLPSGDIVLPEKGISRRHAAITVEGDGVTLRDLGSRNGTLHNGVAAVEARLASGDLVQLGGRGGVELRLERLTGADGELAIRFHGPAAAGTVPAAVTAAATSLLARGAGELLGAVDRLIEQLGTAEVDGWTACAAALRTLAAACGAAGALAGSWDGVSEPLAMAACGDTAAAGELAAALAALRERAAHDAEAGLGGGAVCLVLGLAGGGACRGPSVHLDRSLGVPAGRASVCGRLSSGGGDLLYVAIFGGAGGEDGGGVDGGGDGGAAGADGDGVDGGGGGGGGAAVVTAWTGCGTDDEDEGDGCVAHGLAGIFLRLLDRRLAETAAAQAETGRDAPEAATGVPRSGAAPVRVEAGAGRRAEEGTGARRPGRDLVVPDGYVRSESPAMAQVYTALGELAGSELGLLIEGETGVGKECLVRMLHASSPRAGGPFVAINCAAIPAELLEAELFGIRKGVATGVDERRGRFQQAAGGTLFLDEVADLPPALQAKLLRVIQERMVEPVGGTPRPWDARIVAATNRRLAEEVAQGRFRADLYYRIAGFVLEVPPLRRRREDIPLLLEAFARREAESVGYRLHGITVGALAALAAHSWPGNVRELENEVRCLVRRCPAGGAIDSSMLSTAVLRGGVRRAAAGASGPVGDLDGDPGYVGEGADGVDLGGGLQGALERLERRLILRALERTAGNRSRAARLLGISRNGLAEKMARLGITLRLQAGEQDG